METFENKMHELIEEINPRKINISNASFDFNSIQNQSFQNLPLFLNFGILRNNSIKVPALVPFVETKGIVYLYRKVELDFSKIFIQNLLFELINKITPNKIEIVIYDPTFLGSHFNMINKVNLENVNVELLTEENKLNERLLKYIEYSKELINNKLFSYDSFIDYWNKSEDSDKSYSVFVINDSNFISNNSTTVNHINRITANTKNNNSFFILTDEESSKDKFSFFNSEFTIQNLTKYYNDLIIDLEYEKAQEKLLKNLGEIKIREEQKPIAIETHDIKDGLKIKIGTSVLKRKNFYFRFGCGTENYHAIIGGQSGKGKSVLLNTIINNTMNSYKESEVKFVLFDCKGVEFNEYKNNKFVIECQSTADISLVVEKLKIIEEEFEKRRELFKTNNVKSIEALLEKNITLNRIVCIIDEFQFLFSQSDYKIGQFAEDLLVNKIIRTGRSFGIHLIVATQSLGDGVRRSILDNIPLRIALGMNESQSNSFVSYNNNSAKNLERGLAIYNNSNGELDSNELIKVDKVELI